MKNFNEYLKNSNSIVRLESERILNVLKRYGFEVVNENESKIFISMTIESVGNKVTIGYIIKENEMSDIDIDTMIIDTVHVSFLLLYAINCNVITKEQTMDYNNSSSLIEQEAHFGREIMGAIEGLRQMTNNRHI